MNDLSSRLRYAADRLADAYHGSDKYSPVGEAVERLREAATAIGEPAPKKVGHVWQFYMNGSFCSKCGASLGSGQECR